jgi:hypothetical protein
LKTKKQEVRTRRFFNSFRSWAMSANFERSGKKILKQRPYKSAALLGGTL